MEQHKTKLCPTKLHLLVSLCNILILESFDDIFDDTFLLSSRKNKGKHAFLKAKEL